jgi:Arc/MetJ-type ribon-helix-helix transcriptional regulator
MREVSKQRSIRLPERVDAMLEDLVQEGIFRSRTEAIVEGILRLYEDLSTTESEVNVRLKLTRGDHSNLRRLAQLEGGTEEIWAERLIILYALEHAKTLAKEADLWESVFLRKRELEERTEGFTELRR